MRFIPFFLIAALPIAAQAGVGEIINPLVHEDQFEAQYHFLRTDDDVSSRDGNMTHRLEFEYGFSENWAGEIGFKVDDFNNQDADLKAVYLEFKRTLTRQNEGWWLSTAGLGEYVANTDHGPNKVEAKFLAQRDQQYFRHRANLILEREIGGGDEDEIELQTRWYSRYNLHKHFKPGFEWHAEWGTTNHIEDWDDQEHWVGPSAYGQIFEIGDSELEYQIFYGFGVTEPAEDGVLRFMLEYKREF